uniref:HNH endonuclease signature motif containing protein n=1 Tax=unclassified Microbacterium TaxID=2609290 RepID=UPI0004932A37
PAATPEDLRLLAQVIVQYLDPDGAEPADDIAMRVRGLTLGRAKDGVIPVRGRLLPEVAGQLQRLFDAYLNPKVDGPPVPGVMFRPSDERDADHAHAHDTDSDTGARRGSPADADPDADDDALPSGDPGRMVDTRSRSQKQHDTLAAILGIAARHDDTPRLGGGAPTLVVSVTADDYSSGRGWAHVDGIDTPVSTRVAVHTACAGGVQRVLFDPHGRIIGISTADRIFTAHQRRAITLRDRECLIPGCHVPATWCEIHHVHEHAHGGPTHTDNGVALCWHHHRTLDTSGWEIRMRHGTPHVRGPAWWDPTRRWRTPQPPTPRPAPAACRSTALRA